MLFQKTSEKHTPGAAFGGAPGRCRALRRGYFSDDFEKALCVSEIFENWQSNNFKLAQMQLFQDVNNYGATQDATCSIEIQYFIG